MAEYLVPLIDPESTSLDRDCGTDAAHTLAAGIAVVDGGLLAIGGVVWVISPAMTFSIGLSGSSTCVVGASV